MQLYSSAGRVILHPQMKTTKRNEDRAKRLIRRAQQDHARRVSEENEKRFDRMFDKQGFDPDNFTPHSD